MLRPATERTPTFDLAYVRTRPVLRAATASETATPILVIPGGPGLGSIAPYRRLRRQAARGGLDVIMVEHRGVGASRTARNGQPLTHAAMWVTEVLADLVAVLDHEGIDQVIIAGSSYGSYLAASFGVQYRERVAGMLLDSALQSTADLSLERAYLRDRFWHADTASAHGVRRLARSGTIDEHRLLDAVRAAYELGGDELLVPMLNARLRCRHSPAWWALETYSTRDESIVRIPGHYEFAVAGAIGFRELNYAPQPDGLPLDPALTYRALAPRFPQFSGEPFDLPSATPQFTWPLVVLAGQRDLRTPPTIGAHVAQSAQQGVLVQIDNGHSALDTHPIAFLNAVRWLRDGRAEQLPAHAAQLDRLPRRGMANTLARALRFMARSESTLSRP